MTRHPVLSGENVEKLRSRGWEPQKILRGLSFEKVPLSGLVPSIFGTLDGRGGTLLSLLASDYEGLIGHFTSGFDELVEKARDMQFRGSLPLLGPLAITFTKRRTSGAEIGLKYALYAKAPPLPLSSVAESVC